MLAAPDFSTDVASCFDVAPFDPPPLTPTAAAYRELLCAALAELADARATITIREQSIARLHDERRATPAVAPNLLAQIAAAERVIRRAAIDADTRTVCQAVINLASVAPKTRAWR